MTTIALEQVSKRFAGVLVLDDVSLSLPAASYCALLGPSGSGKSTLLRAIAGLTTIDSGRISLGEEVVSAKDFTTAPEKRGLGMVFQSYAVWPHMRVLENVAYPLERQHVKDARALALAALERVQLEPFAARTPETLSGGQQQRVALARALASRPRALLLDEPLANLDPHLRADLAREFQRAHRDSGLTVLHVTHDREEALALATHVAVLREGRVEQLGSPREVFHHPRTPFVASFVAQSVNVPGRIASCEPLQIAIADGTRVAAQWRGPEAPIAGAAATLCVPAHGFTWGGNLHAEVVASAYAGTHYSVTIAWAGGEVRLNAPELLTGTAKIAINTAWAFP